MRRVKFGVQSNNELAPMRAHLKAKAQLVFLSIEIPPKSRTCRTSHLSAISSQICFIFFIFVIYVWNLTSPTSLVDSALRCLVDVRDELLSEPWLTVSKRSPKPGVKLSPFTVHHLKFSAIVWVEQCPITT